MKLILLKDAKAISGFVFSIVSSILAVVLALNHHGSWVVFVTLAFIVLFFSVVRAEKRYGK
ncbi:hypothetical protein [Planococcus salinus]|uniref:Uncharacterized protein n=1 Tax=Planococcus salinus TaxID=1848460 RepID=A0A3M8P6A5_9BACL|nr:hypothetical protein [Planococcus salinus]RNF39195.1 hypothetical protein EEX84_10875 [Planococcus salinus]